MVGARAGSLAAVLAAVVLAGCIGMQRAGVHAFKAEEFKVRDGEREIQIAVKKRE